MLIRELIKMLLSVCLSVCLFQSLTDVATMVARALYKQAGGAEAQQGSITADPQLVRLLHFTWGLQ